MAGYSSYEICRMLESVMDLELYLENNIYCEVSDEDKAIALEKLELIRQDLEKRLF
jgi:hypothetical protein